MSAWADGILTAFPPDRAGRADRTGTFALGMRRDRDALVHVPGSVRPGRAAPLLVMLHGAGASSSDVMPMVRDCAEAHSTIVAAPDSQGATWDMLQRGYGPDVEFLDRVLDLLFNSYAVDAGRIAIAGFSDGASFALSLGLINGRLFSSILAFSPGFVRAGRTQDAPRIFICHGREDPVLPIDRCGRRVAVSLERSGHDVDYREFTGGHVVPVDMVSAAFARFLD